MSKQRAKIYNILFEFNKLVQVSYRDENNSRCEIIGNYGGSDLSVCKKDQYIITLIIENRRLWQKNLQSIITVNEVRKSTNRELAEHIAKKVTPGDMIIIVHQTWDGTTRLRYGIFIGVFKSSADVENYYIAMETNSTGSGKKIELIQNLKDIKSLEVIPILQRGK